MNRKLMFKITPTNSLNYYFLHFQDRNKVAELAAECGAVGLSLPEPLEIFYDEGNEEFIPINGFDHSTARGRLIMSAINLVYAEAMERLHAQNRRMVA